MSTIEHDTPEAVAQAPDHRSAAGWVWMPHPGHLIVSSDCRFHLTTWIPGGVGTGYPAGVIVSTVGEWLPDAASREAFAEARGIKLHGLGDARRADWMNQCGYQEIGAGRLYETMVFPAEPKFDEDHACCPFAAADWVEIDFAGYNDHGLAYRGHLEICRRWAARMEEVE